MNCSTLERFKGAWIGSMIGDALASNLSGSDYHKIIQYRLQDWIDARDKIAQIAIDCQSVELAIVSSLDILLKYFSKNLQSGITNDTTENSVDLQYRVKTESSKYCCYVMSILLPIIVFQQSEREIGKTYSTIAEEHDNIHINVVEIEREIALWSYLINALLNNKFQLEAANFSTVLARIISGARVKTTSLIAKLEIVSRAWERGYSLQQLADALEAAENFERETATTTGLAIALSLYCFISTPNNFLISVKRAAKLNNQLAVPVTILTASLSGAYNGIGGIPRNWLIATGHHQFYALARETIAQLFATWSGVDNPRNIEISCSPEINAVAAAGVLQPRHMLEIISQKSSLS